MKFFRDWLRVERPPGVALHAAQTVEIPRSYAEVFTRCARGIEDVLGGAVREANQERGTIEATFGLINSERLTCTLTRLDDALTRVLVESRRGATPEPAKGSDYVRALAQYLTNDVRS